MRSEGRRSNVLDKKTFATARELGRILTARPAMIKVLIPAGHYHQAGEYKQARVACLTRAFPEDVGGETIYRMALDNDRGEDVEIVIVLTPED
jgi:hypothetical protein